MSEREAILMLYLYFIFGGASSAEIGACARLIAPLGNSHTWHAPHSDDRIRSLNVKALS